MDKDFLYHLLPEVYRSNDLKEGEQLRAFMRVLNNQFELLHADITQLYDDWFIETCRDNLTPFIFDLVRGGGGESTVFSGEVPRAFVANLMAYRRGKGTASSLCGAIADTTRWSTRLIDFTRMNGYSLEFITVQDPSIIRTFASEHIVVAIANQALYIRVFDINGVIILDDKDADMGSYRKKVEELYSEMTQAKATGVPEGKVLLSLFDLLCSHHGVRICISPIKSFDVVKSKPFKVKEGCYKFNPFGIDAALYGKYFLVDDAVEFFKEDTLPEVAASEEFHLSSNGEVKNELYFVSDIDLGFNFIDSDNSDSSIDPSEISIAPLPDWVWPEGEGDCDDLSSLVVVDPILGRFMISEAYEDDEDSLLVNYSYGFSASLGGGAYDRNLTTVSLKECTWQAYVYAYAEPEDESSNVFSTLQAALNAFDNVCCDGVISILDSNTYELDSGVSINGAPQGYSEQPNGSRSIVIESKNGETPCIRGDISIMGCHPTTNVTLSGLWINGTITVMGGLKLHILHSSIKPLTTPEDGRDVSRQLSLDYDNCDQISLRVEYSIMESILLPEEKSQLSIKNSIVHGKDRKSIGVGVLVVECASVIGDVAVNQLTAIDSIFQGEVNVQNTEASEASYSYLNTTVENLTSKNCVYGNEFLSFTSLEYGQSHYFQISHSASEKVKQGASNGEEMGVFNLLNQASKEQRMKIVLDEFVPHGVKVVREYIA